MLLSAKLVYSLISFLIGFSFFHQYWVTINEIINSIKTNIHHNIPICHIISIIAVINLNIKTNHIVKLSINKVDRLSKPLCKALLKNHVHL